MTEAEIIEMINKKRNELEESRAKNASSVLLKILEQEIENLETSLSEGGEGREEDPQAFVDECAG